MPTIKPTLQQQLEKRKIKQPPKILYYVLTYLWKMIYFKKLGVTVHYHTDLTPYKNQPCIIVSNHASRLDYIYTGLAFLPQRLNFVAGYNEFFRSHLQLIFKLLQVIPKRNFTADVHTIREIARILKNGGKVVLYPEGMSSISGANQPCALGSGKLLKHFGVPVLMTKIKGGYLTSTKYCLDERPGRVDVDVQLLFTPEQLKALSEEEVHAQLDEALKHDDYAWNKKMQIAYKTKGQTAKNLHTLLFWCPICHKEMHMHSENDKIWCSACGSQATLDTRYNLTATDKTKPFPATPRVWFDMQRAYMKQQIQQENYSLQEHVHLGILPAYTYLKQQKTSEIVGEGTLTLDRTGLTYEGTKENAPFTFHLPIKDLPTYGMCTDVSRFYTFYKGEFYEFYPQRPVVEKWFLATEELHRLMGGAWKDFDDAQTRYDDEQTAAL